MNEYDSSRMDLARLVRDAAQIEGIDRIRFTTSHPLACGNALIEAFRDVPQLASHLHLPVQSSSTACSRRCSAGTR